MENTITGLSISIFLFVIGMFASFIYIYIYNWKLSSYLKREKYDRWRELSTIGKFGPGCLNPVRGFKHLYSELDNEDENILRYKDRIKLGLRHFFVFIIALIVNIIVIEVLLTGIRNNGN